MKLFNAKKQANKTIKKLFRKGICYDYYEKGYADFPDKPILMPTDDEFKGVPHSIATVYASMHQAGWAHAQEKIPQWSKEEVRGYFMKELPKTVKGQVLQNLGIKKPKKEETANA